MACIFKANMKKKNLKKISIVFAVFFFFFVFPASGYDRSNPDKPCLDCHGSKASKASKAASLSLESTYVHKPVALNQCSACHRQDDRSAIHEAVSCFKCHDAQKFKGKAYRHPPMEERNYCLSCHRAHSSDHEFLLKDEPVAFCQSCHVGMKMHRSHPVGGKVQDPLNGRAMTCTSTCHNVHLSDFAILTPCEDRKLCLKCHVEVDRIPKLR